MSLKSLPRRYLFHDMRGRNRRHNLDIFDLVALFSNSLWHARRFDAISGMPALFCWRSC